jgi:hypothetical protein
MYAEVHGAHADGIIVRVMDESHDLANYQLVVDWEQDTVTLERMATAGPGTERYLSVYEESIRSPREP